jgi:putative transposase
MPKTAIHRGFKYRLYPTDEQAAALQRAVDAARYVYNLALEQRRDWWRPGRRFSFVQQSRELTELRACLPWLAAEVRNPQEQALRALDRAFLNFFAGRAKFPRWRKQGENDTAAFRGREAGIQSGAGRLSTVRIPGVGWLRYRDTRPLQGRCISVTVSRKAGAWFVSFDCEIEHETPKAISGAVGIDRGVANALALSTGELLQLPLRLVDIDRQRKRAQRIAARRKRGSKRCERAKRRVASLSARAARIRKDFNHRASTAIARRVGMVAIEALKTASMTANGRGKRGLNRSILNQGWAQFADMLAYKIEERGGALIKVNPAYTSQQCFACGHTDARNRESQAAFRCVSCGHQDHADTNAAKNILRRSAPGLDVEASRWRAGEASIEAPNEV